MENKKEIGGKIFRFGIITDMEGNIKVPTIEIEGVKVAKSTLADWIWQGVMYMNDELDTHNDRGRKFFSQRTMKDAITIHGKLIGQTDNEISKTIESFLKE